MRPFFPTLTILIMLVVAASCGGDEPVDVVDHATQVQAWQADRLAGLTAERGWLTLIGLYWLEPGENRIGTAENDHVRFGTEFAPGELGSLFLEKKEDSWRVRLVPAPGSGLQLNGEPAAEIELATDIDPEPDILSAGELEFFIIRREDRFAVRAKHPQAETAVGFTGLDYYPIDPDWRIEARFVPYDEPKPILIPSVIGTTSESLVPGEVRFEIEGEDHVLLPLSGGVDDPEWFYVFRDGTSGHGTYPPGRFLVSGAAVDGSVILDFNRAYNPPCAFTPYATCPLPPKENWLSVAIEAGEKNYGSH
jgi:hypothetical protein